MNETDSQEPALVPADDWGLEPSGRPEEFGLTPDATTEKKRVWDRQEMFLAAYRSVGRIYKAANEVGMTRWAVIHWKRGDVFGFKDRLEVAHADWCEDKIEGLMDERLGDPQGNRGSDILLIAKARAEMPEKYREKVAVSNNDDVVKELLSRLKGLATPRVVEGTSRVVPEEDATPAEDTA